MNAADVARLAAVGRTAVSNWRRRYPDFPQPVGGTPASPLFALAEVEAWLRAQGKVAEVPLAERAWQELRARAGDDLQLAAALADAGELLAGDTAAAPAAVRDLAAALGPTDAFEVLLRRFQEGQARRGAATPPDIAELMAALADGAVTVLDPACGTGELLLAAQDHGAVRLLGQDAAAGTARLAAIRLRFAGSDAAVEAADALRQDVFAGVLADAVLCDPPFHERAWGHEELTADPRWSYGLPPRLEPELAWVQHALAHLAPGGLAVVLMPAAAAARRPGRRIRAQLLRKGALQGVATLSATHQLWLLRPPAPPDRVLMIGPVGQEAIAQAWQAFTAGRDCDDPGVSRAVPIIDLLDEEVDLTPARWLSAPAPERIGERFSQARARLAALAGELPGLLPDLRPAAGAPRAAAPRAGADEAGAVPVAELARMGYLAIQAAPARGDLAPGDQAVLTADDVIAGRPASGRAAPDERWPPVSAGDVAVATAGQRLAARVVTEGGCLLGPGLILLRPDPGRLDPYFLAGVLGSSANAQVSLVQTGATGRADIRRAQIPLLPLAGQRRYGEEFRRMGDLALALRSASEAGADLARLLADGVAGGALEPG